MARNRRNQSAALRLASALRVLFICLFLGGAGVGYVLQKNKIYELGQLQKRLEMELDSLQKENGLWRGQLQELLLPKRLAERVRQMELGLGPARPDQIIWLPEPGAPGRERERALVWR